LGRDNEPARVYEAADERVGQGRVELPTSRLSGVRSNHLSYWPGGQWPRWLLLFPGVSKAAKLRTLAPWKLNRTPQTVGLDLVVSVSEENRKLLRKEVIQPQVPLRLPCYDFTPVTVHSLGPCLSCELA
jgi:hypothetical protein